MLPTCRSETTAKKFLNIYKTMELWHYVMTHAHDLNKQIDVCTLYRDIFPIATGPLECWLHWLLLPPNWYWWGRGRGGWWCMMHDAMIFNCSSLTLTEDWCWSCSTAVLQYGRTKLHCSFASLAFYFIRERSGVEPGYQDNDMIHLHHWRHTADQSNNPVVNIIKWNQPGILD